METLEIMIETPKGSVEKYCYDKDKNAFRLKKILPAGMIFPYDFGFIPDTKGDDGDALDIILLSEFRSFPGCIIECRVIGALLAEQSKGDKMIRNDRYIGVPVLSDVYQHLRSIEELPAKKLYELQQFFTNYNQIQGKQFRIMEVVSADDAYKLMKENKG